MLVRTDIKLSCRREDARCFPCVVLWLKQCHSVANFPGKKHLGSQRLLNFVSAADAESDEDGTVDPPNGTDDHVTVASSHSTRRSNVMSHRDVSGTMAYAVKR